MKKSPPRTFLVVSDDRPEMPVALRYAASRARSVKGCIALLYVIDQTEIYPWQAVDKTFTADAVASAKAALRKHETFIEKMTGRKPTLYVRRGERRLELLSLMEEQPDISVLVLAAHQGPEGPGPLVTYFTSAKGIRKLRIPLVVVPENYVIDEDKLLV
ncbi:MAG: universal stress protein [Bdellovibrionales bacterium]